MVNGSVLHNDWRPDPGLRDIVLDFVEGSLVTKIREKTHASRDLIHYSLFTIHHSLKYYRIKYHIHPSIQLHPIVSIISVNRVLQSPIFYGDLVFRDRFSYQKFLHSSAAHLRKPFIVFLATDRVGVTDQMDIVFFQ